MTSVETAAKKKADKMAVKLAAANAKAEAKKAAIADVEVIGKQISSLVDKINREEDAAVEAWNNHSGKSTTFREELAKVLKDAAPKCKAAGMTIRDLKTKYIGDRLGETQFKQILRIARGAITFQEVKDAEAAKKRVQRSEKKVGTAGVSRPAENYNENSAALRTPNGDAIDPATLGRSAQAQLTRITGSAATELTEEQHKARMAALDVEPVAPSVVPDAEPGIPEPVAQLSPEEISDEALADFKHKTWEYLPKMLPDQRKAARVWLTVECDKLDKKELKATAKAA
jgi:hypothetical protein